MVCERASSARAPSGASVSIRSDAGSELVQRVGVDLRLCEVDVVRTVDSNGLVLRQQLLDVGQVLIAEGS